METIRMEISGYLKNTNILGQPNVKNFQDKLKSA